MLIPFRLTVVFRAKKKKGKKKKREKTHNRKGEKKKKKKKKKSSEKGFLRSNPRGKEGEKLRNLGEEKVKGQAFSCTKKEGEEFGRKKRGNWESRALRISLPLLHKLV